MRVVRGADAARGAFRSPAVTIGIFDGVHLGHRALLEAVRGAASRHGGASVVLTFDRHPLRLFAPKKAPPALQAPDENLALIAASGVDGAVVLPFDEALAGTSAGTFLSDVLGEALGVRAVVLGEKFRFGKGGAGDLALVRETGVRLGWETVVLPKVSVGGHVVSSTRIRTLIAGGKLEEAARMLGRPYAVTGVVEPGLHLGRSLGFPTANLRPRIPLLPPPGVYAGRVAVGVSPGVGPEGAVLSPAAPAGLAASPFHVSRAGATTGFPAGPVPGTPLAPNPAFPGEGAPWLPAVVSIGHRPTIPGVPHHKKVFEAHLPGFDGDLYGKALVVRLYRKLRDEVRFPSLDALRTRIAADVAEALRCLDDTRL
ncbi:MAG: bifunctional riboflavin kinase/FMN adenylyltransferase [Acidobacteria bacterium]|nr:bifunctional riboflavin kinase/FMN adenylyltransferase [Acidobacteriota bacterium]